PDGYLFREDHSARTMTLAEMVALLADSTWSLFRHRCRFSASLSCLDSNVCSILRQSFETRNESQGRQSHSPSPSPLSDGLTGTVPNRLGTHPFPRPNLRRCFPGFSWDLACLWLCDTESATRKKSH